MDDAPFRAAGVLLLLLPVFVFSGTVWFLVSTSILRRLGRLALRSLMTLSLVPSLIIGGLFAVQGFGVGGLGDAAVSCVLSGVGTFICVGVGNCVWWLMRPAA